MATTVMTATRLTSDAEQEVLSALDAVLDPELDEPITDLGFVRSVEVGDGGRVEVHLRLPTSFCSPNFAYLMASDAKDALVDVPWTRDVVVALDDHHDSDKINRGLEVDAGYRGTFGSEADQDLEELRATFRQKAHTAAVERSLTSLMRSDQVREASSLGEIRLRDLPPGERTDGLLRRRAAVGLSLDPDARVLVDHRGEAPDDVLMALRLARSTRISVDGNAHFCRALLRTRYPGAEESQVHRAEGAEPADAAHDPTYRTPTREETTS